MHSTQKLNLRLLYITGLWTGTIPFFTKGTTDVQGMPAFFKVLMGVLAHHYEVHMVLATDRPVSPPPIPGLTVHPVPLREGRTLALVCNTVCVLITAWRVGRKCRPHAVYGHGNYGAVAGIVGPLLRVKHYRRIYGTFLGAKLGQLRSVIGRIKAFFESPLGCATFFLPTDGLVITNDGTRGAEVARAWGVQERKIHFWFNGVDTIFPLDLDWARQTLKQINRDNRPTIVNLSRLDEWKRVDRVILALKELNPRPLLLLIGDGSDRPRLEALVRTHQLTADVVFFGSLASDKARSLLSLADLFVSFYDYANLGNSLIEAMALGKCIVSLDDGSLRGVLTHGHSAFLCSSDEPQAIVTGLSQLLADEELRDKLARGAQQAASLHFRTWDERISREIELLSQGVQQ